MSEVLFLLIYQDINHITNWHQVDEVTNYVIFQQAVRHQQDTQKSQSEFIVCGMLTQ